MSRQFPAFIVAAFTALTLVGCGSNPAPEQARTPAQPAANTQLRDAIQRPIDRAKAVQDKIEEAKEKQDKAVQDQGG